MKRIYLFISIVLVLASTAGAQALSEPQYIFYSDIQTEQLERGNDAEESFNIMVRCLDPRLSERQLINYLYRLYEIRNTSVISYQTYDSVPLRFQCRDSLTNYLHVDFGSPLISHTFTKSNPFSSSYTGTLHFAAPVSKIDPAIFNENIWEINFPTIHGLEYQSSKEIRVDNLWFMEGLDIQDGTYLISKDHVLIAAALKGIMDTVYVPDEVITIGAGAFRGYSSYLKKPQPIIIPANVRNIEDNAFDLAQLSPIFFYAEEMPQFGNDVFGETPNKNLFIYVKRHLVKSYRKQFPSLKKYIHPLPKKK